MVRLAVSERLALKAESETHGLVMVISNFADDSSSHRGRPLPNVVGLVKKISALREFMELLRRFFSPAGPGTAASYARPRFGGLSSESKPRVHASNFFWFVIRAAG